MLFAKSIMLKRRSSFLIKAAVLIGFAGMSNSLLAQDNSPYSRYGLGNVISSSNITTRGMAGISAAYADYTSINFNNPASYSNFLVEKETRSNKLRNGRVVFDVGVSLSNRSLVAPNTVGKFTTSDLLISYLQVGIPLKKNWGLSFGLRPLSKISYKVDRFERLINPTTGLPIDSAVTQFQGTGGSYLPSIGTGFAIGKFSFGANVGYLFGSRESHTLRNLINDTVLYYASDYTTNSSFGDLFFNAGAQYRIDINKTTVLRLGISGNLKQDINGSQDFLRQTYSLGASGEELQIDSVLRQNDVSGKVVYPATYKAGFNLQRTKADFSGWQLGADFSKGKWDDYRFFGTKDSVADNWQVSIGGQLNPRPKENYFSRIAYRFGLYAGRDYIHIRNNIPEWGASFGMGLPLRTSRLSPYQYSIINLALEYGKRGNDDNLLKENIFRISASLNLSDLWFIKRKYD